MKTTLHFSNLLIVLAIFTLFSIQGIAQTTADFESFGLSAGEFNNNAMSAGFDDGNLFFPNDFNAQFSSWTGWSISAATDVETAGYLNQYSSITGSGVDGSTNYIVSYHYLDNYLIPEGIAAGGYMEGMYINNGTYAYLSMLEGDSHAKRFGGETGDDPDFFLLTIKGYLNGEVKTDSIDFYLADFRFDDNDMDYIVNEWTYIDLQPLGNLDSLTFTLNSSDVGDLGMNTPAYFCLDNIVTADAVVSTNNIVVEELSIAPNPAVNAVQLVWPYEEQAIGKLYNMQGQLLEEWTIQNGRNTLDIGHLPSSIFTFICENGDVTTMNRLVKH